MDFFSKPVLKWLKKASGPETRTARIRQRQTNFQDGLMLKLLKKRKIKYLIQISFFTIWADLTRK